MARAVTLDASKIMTRRYISGLFTAFLFFFTTVSTHGASFDCAKADSRAASLICADQSLSDLDRQLGEAYQIAVKADPEERIRHRGWLSERDKKCGREALGKDALRCLTEAIGARLLELRTVNRRSDRPPQSPSASEADISPQHYICEVTISLEHTLELTSTQTFYCRHKTDEKSGLRACFTIERANGDTIFKQENGFKALGGIWYSRSKKLSKDGSFFTHRSENRTLTLNLDSSLRLSGLAMKVEFVHPGVTCEDTIGLRLCKPVSDCDS